MKKVLEILAKLYHGITGWNERQRQKARKRLVDQKEKKMLKDFLDEAEKNRPEIEITIRRGKKNKGIKP